MENTVINNVDQTAEGRGREIIIECHDDVAATFKTQVLDYNDLSAAEKTQLDDCVAMLKSKLPA